MLTSIFFMSERRSRSPSGATKDGSLRTIRAGGFSGTAGIIWGGAFQGRMIVRYGAGRPSVGTLPRWFTIADPVMLVADHASARRFCTGPMIAAVSNYFF